MFAYCNNNPVNSSDRDGEHSDSYYGWLGEEIGVFLYEWITGTDHPSKQTKALENQMVSTQNKMIADATKAMWDAYQRGYTAQQNANLTEAQMMVDGVITAYNFLNETEIIDTGMSGYHTVQAARAYKKSSIYFAAPIPTLMDEAFAVGFLIKGLYHSAKGILREMK